MNRLRFWGQIYSGCYLRTKWFSGQIGLKTTVSPTLKFKVAVDGDQIYFKNLHSYLNVRYLFKGYVWYDSNKLPWRRAPARSLSFWRINKISSEEKN